MGAHRAKRLKSAVFIIGWCGAATAALAIAKTSNTSKLTSARIGSGAVFAAPHPAINVTDPNAPLIGDASLRGEIDLSKLKRAGDGYTVELPGKRSARLTLQPAVQAKAEKVLAKSAAHEGAIVVMGLDGRVLALAGRRQAKPKTAAPKLALEVWAPAASVFKIVTSAALLEAGVKADTRVCYHGGLRGVDASHLEDNPRLDRNCADFGAGLARSQNAIMAKLASKHLDREELADAANRLGFADAADFALDVEANRYQLPKDGLELARVAAGFWSTELSAVGGAVLAASVASRGIRVTPRIVSEVVSADGTRVVLPAPSERVLDEDIAEALGEMMKATCDEGTARSAFRDAKGRRFLGGASVAGKTGSLSISTPEYRGYSWFVGYAPADEPVAVIAVLLANPPKWRLKAHTAARLVLEAVL